YRTKEEVEEERKRDPLVLLRQIIMSQKLGTEADFKQLEREVGEIVAAAVKFADESPFPVRTALEEDVYIE
ncbi:MAG: thiamine pyrophosphate-dependent enzyme, partial [bacterium]